MDITILHLLNEFTFGGTERVIVNLVRKSPNHIRNIIASFYEFNEEFVKEMPDKREFIYCLHKRDGNDIRIPFRIAALSKKFDVDIIHSLGWATYAEGLIAAYLLGKRRRFIHSYRGKTRADLVGIPRRRMYAERLFSNFCEAIVVPSGESKREYAELVGIDASKIRVIYNGVDVDRFRSDGSLRWARRREVGIRDEEVVVGSVGRFDPVKNIAGLVISFSKLKEQDRIKSKLLLVGDGPELSRIVALVKDLELEPRVVFTGMSGDIPKWLSAMDVYVQPSHFEGVPNSVLEAMAAGLPVIATKVGGVPEIVADRETGFLVPLNDQESLTRAIESLVNDLEKGRQMGMRGRRRVTSLFSIENMAKEYEALYEEVLH